MTLFSLVSPQDLLAAMAIAFTAGLVKGIVGFGMPMLLVSALSTIFPPDVALAGLILPTLVTNGMQALRDGVPAAVASIKKFRVYLVVGLIFLLAGAQLVSLVSASTFLLMIGIPVTVFALVQVLGVRLTINAPSLRAEAAFAAVAGFAGGMSGVAGPPTVAYLTAINTPKKEHMQVQGIVYGLCAVSLTLAHLWSGILRSETIQFSAALILPAMAGMWLGLRLDSRIDQETFRKATLFVLLIAGLNLLRRGLMG